MLTETKAKPQKKTAAKKREDEKWLMYWYGYQSALGELVGVTPGATHAQLREFYKKMKDKAEENIKLFETVETRKDEDLTNVTIH